MKKTYIVSVLMIFGLLTNAFAGSPGDNPPPPNGNYVGAGACVCHANILQQWATTLHYFTQSTPSQSIWGPWNGTTIPMGSAYGNATVTLSITNGVYQVTLNPATGSPVTYPVLSNFVYGWVEYFLVKINNSNYRLPFRWTNGSYMNPTGFVDSIQPGHLVHFCRGIAADCNEYFPKGFMGQGMFRLPYIQYLHNFDSWRWRRLNMDGKLCRRK